MHSLTPLPRAASSALSDAYRNHPAWAAFASIVVIVAGALVLRWVIRRLIDRVVHTVSTNSIAERITRTRIARGASESDELISERTTARARTVGQLLKSIGSFVILGAAAVMVLSLLGVNVAPIVASAGVVGVAVGFGAQSLIKDFLTGVFMIFEDQYGVGDEVDLGQAVGTVQQVGLRLTTLRDPNGVVWYVPNGVIQRVGNKSQGWAIAKVDVPVAHDQDVEHIQQLLQAVADDLSVDPEWTADILDEPATATIEALTPESMTIRVELRTLPTRQRAVARELRLRLKQCLDEAEIAYRRSPRALS